MSRVIVALDVDTVTQAASLVASIGSAAGAYKVGKQLFVAEGPAAIAPVVDAGHRLFLDLKFHDIPNTVAGAVRSATRLGAWMLTVHASGGGAMMRAAAEAAAAESARLGTPRPLVVGVTLLTSLDAAAVASVGMGSSVTAQVSRLARLALNAGLDGVVSSPKEIGLIRETCGQEFLIVTPGIRPRGSGDDDQARTLTPADAVRAGAGYLVVGRPITAAADPRAAADAINRDIEGV